LRSTRPRLEVDGRELVLSNLDKILYPEAGFTKGQVIDFYIRVSRFLLPHLKDRPVTLKRYPNGVTGKHFYQKDAPRYRPEWIRTFPVPRREGGEPIHYILIDDVATLAWCANLANLELHPFLHRAPLIDQPTSVVFDLDPGEGSDILTCARVAFLLKELFEKWDFEACPKVSGSRGIQVYIPLNGHATYAQTQPFARTIAEYLTREHPELVVARMAKQERTSKVLVDWSQNSDFKTTVSVYSLRAKNPRPFVSMPVSWEELRRALSRSNRESLYFSPEAALKRLERSGDQFAPVLTRKQKLPNVSGSL
jgi:bifunctional non-homologous end joining protein LigD